MSSHSGKLSDDELVRHALQIVKVGDDKGIILRILGALAFFIHSQHNEESKEAFTRLDRLGGGKSIFSDLDMAAYSKQGKAVEQLLRKELRLTPNMMINTIYGHRRLMFFHPANLYSVDIFIDKLEYSHDVLFGKGPGQGRLELDFPTLDLADLVLEKIQIHQINRKDLLDLTILFMSHEIEIHDDKEIINGKYIAQILANDWGFWYDGVNNLKQTCAIAKNCLDEGKISSSAYDRVQTRVKKLLNYIEEEPKTMSWKIREKTGISKTWYREVDELRR